MSNVLIVLSPTTDAPAAVAYALRRAKELRGELVGLVTLRPDAAQRIATTLADKAFIGEKVSEDVIDALEREQHTQAESCLGRIAIQAHHEGIPFTPLIEAGEPSEVCGRVAAAHDVQLAVLVAEKRSWLTRLLSPSSAVKLPALFGCEVKVMDD